MSAALVSTAQVLTPVSTSHCIVRFDLTPLGDKFEAVFECLPCGELMWRDAELEAWACSECGFLLRHNGAEQVVERARVLLDELIPPRKNISWGWVTWLLRLLGRKPV